MMEQVMKERLDGMMQRDKELNEQMMDPAVLKDSRTLAKVGKELSSIQQTLSVYRRYLESKDFHDQAFEMLEMGDKELAEMAKMEIEDYQEKMNQDIDELRVLLIPKDPSDHYDAIVEIQGAAGGDEANIFAGDLYRMYTRYAESLGFKYEVIESSPAAYKGEKKQ